MGSRLRSAQAIIAFVVGLVLTNLVLANGREVLAHEPIVVEVGSYMVRFEIDPLDPIARQPSFILLNVRNSTSDETVPVTHTILNIVTPGGTVEGPTHAIAPAQTPERIEYTFTEAGQYGVFTTLFLQNGETLSAAFIVPDVLPAEPPSILTLLSSIQRAMPRMVVKWLHVASAMIWVGGIAFGLALFYPSLTTIGAERGDLLLRRYVKYATPMIGVAIIVLGTTGLLRTDFHGITIFSLDKLIGVSYGLAILLKMIIFSVMVVLGVVANILWAPKLVGSLDGNPTVDRTLLRRIMILNGAEVILGVVAAFLGSTILLLHSVF